MGRKGGISGKILTCIGLLAVSCTDLPEYDDVTISFSSVAEATKALLPDEEKITDVTLLIFDSNGMLEYSLYDSTGADSFKVSLLKGELYSFHAFVNFGYKVRAKTWDEMQKTEYHLAYPDEYREGIPMYASADILIEEDLNVIFLEPVRLMSRISIKIDRSRLSPDVEMNISSVRIGNCPKRIRVFGQSGAENEGCCFTTGFTHTGPECSPLNKDTNGRISDELSMYMLENMQGNMRSYIEIELDYSSGSWLSSEYPLIYRFYLGNGENDFNVERNCHYHITVCPENEGLNGDSWRIDKSGLVYSGATSLEKYPSEYIRGNIGDKIHLGCKLTPPHTPFDIGLEYLEDDRKEGLYEYDVDADGHGVNITLTGAGRGLIYMEAGDPINEAALFIIEVNLPERQQTTLPVYPDKAQ